MNINPETGLYGEYGFIYEPFWQKPSFIIPTAIVITLVFISVTYFLYRYYQKRKIAKMTPAQRAFYMLNKLEKNNDKNIKKFAENILIIIKTYGEKKYQTKIMHYTLQECIDFFCSKINNDQERTQIKQLFLDIELILFSDNYKNQESFFTKAPKAVASLIKSLETSSIKK